MESNTLLRSWKDRLPIFGSLRKESTKTSEASLMDIKRVMLAVKAKDFESINYPVLASTKIDGIRAINKEGVLLSRTMTAIPNAATQRAFGAITFHGLDGELVVGNPYDPNCMQQTMSGVMSQDGDPNPQWYIFDNWDIDKPYMYRAREAKKIIEELALSNVHWLPQTLIRNCEELYRFEETALNQGYEGVIIRAPDAPYKQNRSTLREGYMLKIKRFVDSEAEILDAYELMHNNNEATTDARGYTKRATNADGKTAAGILGGLLVRDIHSGVDFELGTGFTLDQRKNLWQGKKYLPGKIAKYKHFPVGVVDKPRHPIFLGFRDRRDI